MKKSLWIWIPLAAVLLTGCSGNDGADSIAEGMTAMENKEYQAALEDFKAAAALGENDAAAYRGEGLALMGLGQYAEAAQAFDTALEATDEKMPNTKRDILYYKATALYKNQRLREHNQRLRRDPDPQPGRRRLLSPRSLLHGPGRLRQGEDRL